MISHVWYHLSDPGPKDLICPDSCLRCLEMLTKSRRQLRRTTFDNAARSADRSERRTSKYSIYTTIWILYYLGMI